MATIELRLPAGAIVRGELPPAMDLDYLAEDILQVELPNGVIVDLGWLPAWDPSGSFVVSVYRHNWQNQLRDQYFAQDIDDAAQALQRFAAEYSQMIVFGSSDTGHMSTEQKVEDQPR